VLDPDRRLCEPANQLHRDFELALGETKLPERPGYEAVNRFLIKAGREMISVNAEEILP